MAIFDPELGAQLSDAVTGTRGMVTGMVTIAEYIDNDGEQRVSWAVTPGQKATTTAGLLALAQSLSDFELRMAVGAMNSDEWYRRSPGLTAGASLFHKGA